MNRTRTVQLVAVSFLVMIVLLGTVAPIYKVHGISMKEGRKLNEKAMEKAYRAAKGTDNRDWKEKEEYKAEEEDDREDQTREAKWEKEKDNNNNDNSGSVMGAIKNKIKGWLNSDDDDNKKEEREPIFKSSKEYTRDRDDDRDRDNDRHDRDDDDRDRHDHDDDDDDKDVKVVIKEKDNDDDDEENDLLAYNHGYRDGQFDRMMKLPYNDNMVPIKGDSSETMYKVGYSVGWNSITGSPTGTVPNTVVPNTTAPLPVPTVPDSNLLIK